MALPDEGLERLKARARQPESLVEFFAKSPLAEVTIDLERGARLRQDSRIVSCSLTPDTYYG